MFVLTRFAEGLLIAHLCLGIFFLVGAALFPWFELDAAPRTAPETALRVLCTCIFGASVTGLLLLLLAMVGLLAPLYIGVAILVAIAAPAPFWKTSPLSPAYWQVRGQTLRACWDVPLAIVYAVMLVEALPAIIPNVGGDPIHYHLAYAEDWARTGKLTVDPFLRFPFYASNFVLFFAAFFAMHADVFINFLCWLTGLLTALAICAFARHILKSQMGNLWSAATAIFLPVAVAASPVYWRWMDTAYMDVAIAAFALFTTLMLYLAAEDRQWAWVFPAGVTAGFLLGTKSSFLLFIPVYAISVFVTARYLKAPARVTVAAVVLLLVAASPWYVRNLVEAGDPSPPAFNLLLHKHDGLIDASEWATIQSDLFTTKTPKALLTLPVRAFKDAQTSSDFREYGIGALIMLLYLPQICLLLRFASGKRIEFGQGLFIATLTILTAYWFMISTIERYGLLLYPMLALCCVFCAQWLVAWKPRAAPVVAVIALLSIIPTPASKGWYWERYNIFYRYVALVYKGDQSYLRKYDNGYAEEQFTVSTLRRRNLHGRVFALGGDVDYFFRRDGITSMGDWIGPGGFFRLYRAVDAGQAGAYLHDLDAVAVLVSPRTVIGGLDVPLGRQLLKSGYTAVRIPQSTYRLYVLRGPG